ncbi:hypothetical protein Gotur_003923 [Gossypium turneri]
MFGWGESVCIPPIPRAYHQTDVWLGVILLHPYSLPPLLLILAVIAILMFKRRLGIPPQISNFLFRFLPLILSRRFPSILQGNFFPFQISASSSGTLLFFSRFFSFLHFINNEKCSHSFPVISIPLLSCFPHIAMLSGVVLHLVTNCATILRNTLSVSESKS